MHKMHLYLPIEIKPRELSSKILTAAVASNGLIRSYIGSKSSIKRLVLQKNDKAGWYIFKGGDISSTVRSFAAFRRRAVSDLVGLHGSLT
jgi:hypothetical protein